MQYGVHVGATVEFMSVEFVLVEFVGRTGGKISSEGSYKNPANLIIALVGLCCFDKQNPTIYCYTKYQSTLAPVVRQDFIHKW